LGNSKAAACATAGCRVRPLNGWFAM